MNEAGNSKTEFTSHWHQLSITMLTKLQILMLDVSLFLDAFFYYYYYYNIANPS